jgi:hypothetical protein
VSAALQGIEQAPLRRAQLGRNSGNCVHWQGGVDPERLLQALISAMRNSLVRSPSGVADSGISSV